MDLATAAAWFDTTDVLDPDTGEVLFEAQLDVYDDSKRDGVGTERRILSFSPLNGLAVPAGRVVRIAEKLWVMGNQMPDVFDGEVIRKKFIIQRAEQSVQIQDGAGWLAGTTTTDQPCGAVWTKDMKYESYSDEVRSFFTLWMASAADVQAGQFAMFNGRLQRVRNVYRPNTGLLAVEIVEMPIDCLQDVRYTAAATSFDPVKGAPGTAVPVTMRGIAMQYFDEYRYVTQAMAKPSRGDIELRVLARPGLKTGDTFAISGVTMKVVTFLTERDGTYLVHLTR